MMTLNDKQREAVSNLAKRSIGDFSALVEFIHANANSETHQVIYSGRDERELHSGRAQVFCELHLLLSDIENQVRKPVQDDPPAEVIPEPEPWYPTTI